MKITIYCNNCGKKIETWSETRRFCSNECSTEHRLKKLHQEPTHPIAKLASQYKDCEISKIPEETLTEFMKWGLYDFTKLLERNNLKEFCERYREFVKFNKLCKNCGRIYPATKRSGSKCPYPECQEYNSVRWANGVAKNKATKLKNWGDENYNNYEKQVQTMMERYSVRAPMQRQESKDKAKKTCQEKYKTDYPMQNEGVKAKGRNTSIIKWGVPYPSQTEAVKNKMKNSLIKNYGVPHSNYIGMPHYEDFNTDYISKNFIISGELQEAQVRDYFKFYDVKPVLKLLDAANIQYKRQPKGTRGQKDFFYQFLQIYNTPIEYEKTIKPYRVDGFISPENFTENLRENFKIPQNSKGLIIEYLGDFWHGNLRYYGANETNPKTSKNHLEEFENTFKRFDSLLEAGYSVIYIWESDYQKFGLSPLRLYADYSKIISNFLNENNINFTKNNDIFSIPEHGIELRIHRFEAYPKYTKKGIYNITKEASQRGIRVIHIFEQYIKIPQKFEIIKNAILHACGRTKHKVYARNLTIEVKKSAELKDFFNENNIAGHRGAEFGICLMQDNDIIMAYSIGKPFFGKGKYDAEIVRGACKIGYSVIGGASKIWNYLIKNYDYNSIVYYVDLNCYNGQSMGFLKGCEYIGEKPGFWNYWVETQELKNREPARHAEIMQKTRAGEIITITNAGSQVNVWHRRHN